MRVDLLEETLDRLEREGRRPKFIYTVPTFQNPGGVTMSLPRRKRLVEVAHERELLVLEDNPYGLLRYEGEPLPTLRSLDGGDLRDVPRHVLEDPLAGHARSAGSWRRRRCSRRSTSASRRADLCTSTLSQLLVARLLRAATTGATTSDSLTEIYRAPARHDARRARRALPAAGRVDAPRRRPVHLGDAARLHRHDRPARARAARRTSRSCPARARSSTAADAARCG